MSSGTFSQIYIQVVLAVKRRECLIKSSWEDTLYKYMSGVVQNQGQKMIAINGMPDHLHFFIGMKPTCRLSDLVRDVKRSSTLFIQKEGFTKNKFTWQSGYGAFSYSHSAIDNVVKYIQNQKEHHSKRTFKEEYMELLSKFEVDFNEEFIFHEL
jgi:REP element-mobilizing transposase RayT